MFVYTTWFKRCLIEKGSYTLATVPTSPNMLHCTFVPFLQVRGVYIKHNDFLHAMLLMA